MSVFVKGFSVLAVLAALFFGKAAVLKIKNVLAPEFLLRENSEEILRKENAVLRAELEKLLLLKEQVVHFKPETISAAVYSTYPFNSKNFITIGAGKLDGVKTAMAVTSDGMLVGIVEEVFKNTSVVKTIFDPSFEMPVRIGERGVKALLKGGANPEIVFIQRGSNVRNGDGVYSTSADIPYGLAIGEVKNIQKKEGEAWESASLLVVYSIDKLNAVSIISNFK